MWALAREIEAAIAVKRTFRMLDSKECTGSKKTPQRNKTRDGQRGEGGREEKEG